MLHQVLADVRQEKLKERFDRCVLRCGPAQLGESSAKSVFQVIRKVF
jgi:hypothetical protein